MARHIPMLSQDLGHSLWKSAWTDLWKQQKEVEVCLFQHLSLSANSDFDSNSVSRGSTMIKFVQNLPWRFREACKKGKQGRDALSPSLKATTSYALKQSSDQIKPTRLICSRNSSASLVRGWAGQLCASNQPLPFPLSAVTPILPPLPLYSGFFLMNFMAVTNKATVFTFIKGCLICQPWTLQP